MPDILESTACSHSHQPVWDLYDAYRNARFNVRYYSELLHRTRLRSSGIDIALAITAPSSALAGLVKQKLPDAWVYLSAITAVLALIKPIIRLNDRMRILNECVTGYRILEHELECIVLTVSQEGRYDKKCKDRLIHAFGMKGKLLPKEPNEKIDERLRRKCFDLINQELPCDKFSIPQEPVASEQKHAKSTQTNAHPET